MITFTGDTKKINLKEDVDDLKRISWILIALFFALVMCLLAAAEGADKRLSKLEQGMCPTAYSDAEIQQFLQTGETP